MATNGRQCSCPRSVSPRPQNNYIMKMPLRALLATMTQWGSINLSVWLGLVSKNVSASQPPSQPARKVQDNFHTQDFASSRLASSSHPAHPTSQPPPPTTSSLFDCRAIDKKLNSGARFIACLAFHQETRLYYRTIWGQGRRFQSGLLHTPRGQSPWPAGALQRRKHTKSRRSASLKISSEIIFIVLWSLFIAIYQLFLICPLIK